VEETAKRNSSLQAPTDHGARAWSRLRPMSARSRQSGRGFLPRKPCFGDQEFFLKARQDEFPLQPWVRIQPHCTSTPAFAVQRGVSAVDRCWSKYTATSTDTRSAIRRTRRSPQDSAVASAAGMLRTGRRVSMKTLDRMPSWRARRRSLTNSARDPAFRPLGANADRPVGGRLQGISRQPNQLLAMESPLRDLYKKHHWQVAAYHRSCTSSSTSTRRTDRARDALAERIRRRWRLLAMAPMSPNHIDPRPPKGREERRSRFRGCSSARDRDQRSPRDGAAQRRAATMDERSTVSEVIRRNEQQAWFLAEHVIDVPLVRA